jgi:hypothetical protein
MADLQLDSVTNSSGTGIFDKLMTAVNNQIETQYLNNRITGSDYATVYLGSIQSVLQQSIQFVLQEQLTEAQIDDVVAGTALKAKQAEIAEVERLAKQYEVDNILPEQLIKLQEEIDLLQTQDSEALLDGVSRRALQYTEQVLKDKQAAKLGLDNVMKNAEADKVADPNAVYSPKYEVV